MGMAKSRLFHLKNDMLGANGLANFIGVLISNIVLARSGPTLPEDIWINPLASAIDWAFTPSAFVFVVIMTFLYEKPIRRYLNASFSQVKISGDLQLEARKRILNEPFVLMALDLSMWVLAAIIYPAMHWFVLGTGLFWVQRSFFISLSTGLITVTIAFFFLEYVLQKKHAPYFFPDGGLSEIPKTVRIRIGTRLWALFFACNLIPLFSILYTSYSIRIFHQDFKTSLEYLHSAVFANTLVFVSAGIFLTMFVSRNMTLPFGEILSTLGRIRNGLFDRKVSVTSSDEIGYTGDVINEMTKGLQEREFIKEVFGKYVSKEIRDEVLSGGVSLDGEKKDVTIVFSDLRNFTPLTESNDPKVVVKIMNSYFEEMSTAIEEQGGLVLQFIGDEIYAVFGAPIALEDHPTRALRAGLEMSHRLVKLNKKFSEKGWPELKQGIGIHSGKALAANIGSPDRLSYLLVGDTVNLASRLQTLTKEVGTEMIISSVTHARLVQSESLAVKMRKLPPVRVKGKTQPVEIYALNRP
jgi:adenylate cyclase